MGNINPTGNILLGRPDEVKIEVMELMKRMDPYSNFILSTGCDLPQETPLENIRTFIETGRNYQVKQSDKSGQL